MPWYKLSFNCTNPDDLIGLGIFHGAAGGQVVNHNDAVLYLCEPDVNSQSIANLISGLGGKDLKIEPLPEENWNSSCVELWDKLSIGGISVLPVSSAEQAAALDTDQKQSSILIIPGTGFGTGHHATTSRCIQYLQHRSVSKLRPARALDFGCGSGILAITIAKLYPACSVLAVDNDKLALENAAENLALNNAEGQVSLMQADLKDLAGNYDILVANVYAEVLVKAAPIFDLISNKSSLLILSGISADKLTEVLEAYSRWSSIEQSEVSGWISLLLARVR